MTGAVAKDNFAAGAFTWLAGYLPRCGRWKQKLSLALYDRYYCDGPGKIAVSLCMDPWRHYHPMRHDTTGVMYSVYAASPTLAATPFLEPTLA